MSSHGCRSRQGTTMTRQPRMARAGRPKPEVPKKPAWTTAQAGTMPLPADSDFVAAMEGPHDSLAEPSDPRRPRSCSDQPATRGITELRGPWPARPVQVEGNLRGYLHMVACPWLPPFTRAGKTHAPEDERNVAHAAVHWRSTSHDACASLQPRYLSNSCCLRTCPSTHPPGLMPDLYLACIHSLCLGPW